MNFAFLPVQYCKAMEKLCTYHLSPASTSLEPFVDIISPIDVMYDYTLSRVVIKRNATNQIDLLDALQAFAKHKYPHKASCF